MIDIEANVIGNVLKTLSDPATLDLSKNHFSCSYGKKIWAAIEHHVSRKITPDLMTISDYLEKTDLNGSLESWTWMSHLGQMAKDSLPPSSVNGHAKVIRQKWKVRQIKTIGAEMSNDDDADINQYIKSLMELNTTEKNYLHSFADAADNALDEVEKVMQGESVTIPTGLTDVDKVMGGLHKSDLIIVAARSAMGKTAFLLNMAAANKTKPLIFSTEQSNVQAAFRLFSIYGNVPNHLIRTGEIGNEEFGRISAAITEINGSDGMIYDKSGPYMSEIESTAREVYHNHGCTAIYLDYLQRIKHENPKIPRHEQVGDIAMRLKELARELDIPVVALAQVSRKVEARENKRPDMGDIKDSGTIEQEADSILTIYRDEVYNEDSNDKGTAEINFKKNRHGGTGMIRVKWTAPTMRFTDMTTMSY